MHIDFIIQELQPWIASRRRPAWRPIVEEGDGSTTISKFGGLPFISENAPWPQCTNCNKPLLLFLQLDLNALPAELNAQFGSGLLQLFYCTRDDCQGFGGWDPFEDTLSRVRVVQPDGPGVRKSSLMQHEQIAAKRIVGWSRFFDLPSSAEHAQLGLRHTYDFRAGTHRVQCSELNLDITNRINECPAEKIADSELLDKLGGWPAWVQGVEYPTCPECGQRMIHVFQVDSEDHIPFMFGDVGCGHITQCPTHKNVVAFGWACS